MARQPDSGRADHMRSEQPTKIASRNLAVSDSMLGRVPVGGWTLDLEPHVKRNVAPAGSRAESLELSAMVPEVREPLILISTLQ